MWKNFKEAFEATIRVRMSNFFPFKEILGRQVVLSTDLVMLAGMPKNSPGACVIKFKDGVPRIVVNEKFMELPVIIQDPILAHEEGHIQLFHLEKSKYVLIGYKMVACFSIVPEIEYAADLFAAKKCGFRPIITALRELIYRVDSRSARAQLVRRVKRLREAGNE